MKSTLFLRDRCNRFSTLCQNEHARARNELLEVEHRQRRDFFVCFVRSVFPPNNKGNANNKCDYNDCETLSTINGREQDSVMCLKLGHVDKHTAQLSQRSTYHLAQTHLQFAS